MELAGGITRFNMHTLYWDIQLTHEYEFSGGSCIFESQLQ